MRTAHGESRTAHGESRTEHGGIANRARQSRTEFRCVPGMGLLVVVRWTGESHPTHKSGVAAAESSGGGAERAGAQVRGIALSPTFNPCVHSANQRRESPPLDHVRSSFFFDKGRAGVLANGSRHTSSSSSSHGRGLAPRMTGGLRRICSGTALCASQRHRRTATSIVTDRVIGVDDAQRLCFPSPGDRAEDGSLGEPEAGDVHGRPSTSNKIPD